MTAISSWAGFRRLSPPWMVAGAALLFALLLPFMGIRSSYVFTACTVGVYILAAIGMNILHGFTGQVSLGQGALVAIGAYTTGILTVLHGWSFWSTVIPAILIAMLVAVVFALPALRLSRWYLGMITLVLAGLVQEVILQAQNITNGGAGIVGIPQITFGSDVPLTLPQIYYLILAFVVASMLLAYNLKRSPMGLAMMAIRDSEIAAQASSISVPRIKLFAFVISAITAGVAGVFLSGLNGVITPDEFDVSLSIFILLAVLVGGDGSLEGPVLGAIILFALPQMMLSFAEWRGIIYGVLLLFIAIFAPFGISGLFRGAVDRILRRDVIGASKVKASGAARERSKALADITAARRTGEGLSVRGAVRRFGGVVALDDVSVKIEPGVIHGVIGPNGSGKTTLLNLISGFYPLNSGTVLIGDKDVSSWRPNRIAKLGVARTFQQPKLLDPETVLDNVKVGAYRHRKATLLEWLFRVGRSRSEERATNLEAMSWLEFLGIDHLASIQCKLLPHGQRRLIEIARALASHPTILLLDEPAAGLPPDEISRLAGVIVAVKELGITVMLVEHHIDLIIELASTLTVMHRGKVLADGPAADVMKMPAVLSAYVGVAEPGTESTTQPAAS